MKVIEFILYILACICIGGMLYANITRPSPMKGMVVISLSIMFIACLSFARKAIKELKED